MQLTGSLPAPVRRLLPLGGMRLWPAAVGLAIVVVVGGALLLGPRLFAPAAPAVQGQVVPVRQDSVAATVSATGSVVATRQAKLVFGASGRIKEIAVAVGDRVTSGQVLARLGTDALQVKVEQARSQLAAARLKLQQLGEGASAEEVLAAQAAYGAATAKLAQVEGGPTAADLQAAEASLASARASYEQAAARLVSLQSGTGPADLAASQAGLESARNSLASSEAKLAQLSAGASLEDQEAAQASVDQARASLRSAEAKLDQVKAGPTAADLTAAQASYDQAVASATSSRAKLDQLRATSGSSELVAAQVALARAEADLVSARRAYDATADDLAKAKADRDYRENQIERKKLTATQTCEKEGTDSTECHDAQLDVDALYAGLADARSRVRSLDGPNSLGVLAARESLEAAQLGFESARLKVEQVKTVPAELVSAQASYDSATASLASAKAKLEQVRSGPTAADLAAAQSSVDSARASLISAEAKQRTVLLGVTPADLVAAEMAVETARANLASAEARLAATRATGPLDLDTARASAESARMALESAAAKLDQVKAGSTEADLQAARSSVLSAQASLALKTGSAKASDLALQQESVRQAELALRSAELDLDNSILTAPFDGVVAAITGNVGENAPSGTTGFIVLVDPSNVRIDVTVDESDVARVQVGKPAQISFDAIPGRPFGGKVLAVSPNGTVTQGVVSYPVSLSIEARNQMLPVGLTASTSIVIEQRDNVLVVPNRAVRRQGRDQVVDVVGPDGKPIQRVVRTGVSNDQVVEVVEGLSEGEEVLVATTTTRGANVFGGAPGVPGAGGGRPVVVTKPGG